MFLCIDGFGNPSSEPLENPAVPETEALVGNTDEVSFTAVRMSE